MRRRGSFEVCLAAGLALATTVVAPSARADDDQGHRLGLVAAFGGGLAGVVHPGPLPALIGFTDLGGEILGEIRPWGGFLRVDFLSSGDDGRWTAYSFDAGTQYRLFGDARHWALFLRGGVAYERWLGNNGQGCAITFVVPNSCVLFGQNNGGLPQKNPAPPFSTTTDMLGVLAGVRLELPLPAFYVALGATFVPTVSVDAANPVATFQLRFDLTVGFRDTRRNTAASRDYRPPNDFLQRK